MILVVGGRASGKRTYVEGLGFDADDVSCGRFDDRPVLLNLEDALRLDGREPAEIAEAVSDKQVVTCCEVGGGIVPLDPAERAWREKVGRTCNLIADRAETVVRMVCGIPVFLKGNPGDLDQPRL